MSTQVQPRECLFDKGLWNNCMSVSLTNCVKYEGISGFTRNKGDERENIFYHTLFEIKKCLLNLPQEGAVILLKHL